MNTGLRMALVGLLFSLGAAVSFADDLTAQKRDDVKKLLEVSGSLATGKSMSESVVNSMSAALKQSRPDLPPKTFDILSEEVNKVVNEELSAKGGLVDLMIELYHKYYTHDEIKTMLAFFDSPIGKKTAALGPKLAQEGYALGNKWGQERLGPVVAERVKARLKKEGINI